MSFCFAFMVFLGKTVKHLRFGDRVYRYLTMISLWLVLSHLNKNLPMCYIETVATHGHMTNLYYYISV
jgi:hypothetical protein